MIVKFENVGKKLEESPEQSQILGQKRSCARHVFEWASVEQLQITIRTAESVHAYI